MNRPNLSIYLRLTPALGILAILLGASLVYGVGQSLGFISSIDDRQISLNAYENLVTGHGSAGREFWISLGFSLWISLASTAISLMIALFIASWLNRRTSRLDVFALNWNLAFPHLVWAVGILLILGQSGLLARWAAALGLIEHTFSIPSVGARPLWNRDHYLLYTKGDSISDLDDRGGIKNSISGIPIGG